MQMFGETYVNEKLVDHKSAPDNSVEFQLGDKITFGAQKSGVTIQFRMCKSIDFFLFFS